MKDARLWRASRPFAFHGGDEIVVEVFPLEWSGFLLFLVLLGSSTRALIIIRERLALPSFIAEEGADRFFPRRVVGHYVHPLVDSLGAVPA